MAATETDAERPVYWIVQYREQSSGKLVSTIMTHARCSTRREALRMTFGIGSLSPAFTFHNAGTNLEGARKLIKKEKL